MRSHLVVRSLKAVEPSLLCSPVGGGRSCGLSLERSVHAFVSSVLLGVSWLDELRVNAESDPPDGEPRDPSERGRCERSAVVRADDGRQAILPEGADECLLSVPVAGT